MLPDAYLRRKIRDLRDKAIEGTSVDPGLTAEVAAAAMTMAAADVAAYLAKQGHPVDGFMSPANDTRIIRKPPWASWIVTLYRHQNGGGFSWQFIATCSFPPKSSDLAYLNLMKDLLGIPPSQPMTVSEDWPEHLQQQHFIWIWDEPRPPA
jgi:hypothetical protein